MSYRRRMLLGLVGALSWACGADESVSPQSGAGASGSGGSAGTAGHTSGGVGGDSGSGGQGAAGASCDVANAADIAVAEIDLEGYPPYAIEGCKLAYVSAKNGGALMLRNLAAGDEMEVAPAAESPRRPTLAGDVLAWQAGEASASVVRISFGGSVRTATGAFVRAGEPRAAADAVVFTGWLGPSEDSDTDVFLARADAGAAQLVLGGPGQQRFADVSQSHVALSDFSEDPAGIYSGDGTSLADLVVVDRSGGSAEHRRAAGKQAFPMLGSPKRVVFLEWLGVHPVPKLQEYTLRVAEIAALAAEPVTIHHVTSDRPTVRPVTRGNLVEWVERPIGSGSLFYRARLDAGQSPVMVSGLDGLELFAPAASTAITVIAARPLTGGAPTLRAFER